MGILMNAVPAAGLCFGKRASTGPDLPNTSRSNTSLPLLGRLYAVLKHPQGVTLEPDVSVKRQDLRGDDSFTYRVNAGRHSIQITELRHPDTDNGHQLQATKSPKPIQDQSGADYVLTGLNTYGHSATLARIRCQSDGVEARLYGRDPARRETPKPLPLSAARQLVGFLNQLTQTAHRKLD